MFRSPRTFALACACLVLVGFDWGGRLGRLRSDLASPDPETRASAVRELAHHARADVEGLVLDALADADPAVRLDAAETAARLHIDAAAPIVLEWLDEDDEVVRAGAARALGPLTHPDIASALIRALSDPRADVRSAALQSLSSTTHRGPDAARAVLTALDDPDGAVRAAAVVALGEIHDPGAVFALATRTSDDVPEVRAAVATSLGALGEARAATSLRRLLDDPVEDVRIRAALALGRLQLDEASPELEAIARAASSEGARELAQAAIAALGRLSTEGSFDALADVGARGDPEIRSAAHAALLERLRLRPEETRARIASTLAERSLASRAEWVAAELAAGATDRLPEASVGLIQLLDDGRLGPEVAFAALGHTAGDAALERLLVALDDAQLADGSLDPSLTGLVTYFRVEGPDGRASEPLLDALGRAADPLDRVRLVRLLGQVRSARSAAPLLDLLGRDADPRVHREVYDVLSAIGEDSATSGLDPATSSAAIEASERGVRDVDPAVRAAAARALSWLADAPAVRRALVAIDTEAQVDRPLLARILGEAGRRLTLDPDARSALARSLGQRLDDEDPGLADAALDALARWGSPEALELILAGLAHQRARGPSFVLALGRFELEPALDALRAEYAGSDADRRAAAAGMLGEHGTRSDAERLLADLRELPWPASAAASFALTRLARRGVLADSDGPALCALGAQNDPIVRANVAVALTALGARCGAPDLRSWLVRPHAPIVRAAALRYLGPTDPAALQSCEDDLPPPLVLAVCEQPELPPLSARADVTAYELDGVTLARRRLLALILGDGSVLLARTDANAHLVLEHAPVGALAIEEPSSLPLEP